MQILDKDISELSIGIIGGNGQMGKLFAKFLGTICPNIIVSDLLKKTKYNNISLTEQADIVIISVPILKTTEVIKEILPSTRKKQILMDLTSIKSFPIKAMLKGKSEVIGLHPMFGPGVKKLQTIVMCAARTNHSQQINDLFTKLGATVETSTAANHDKIMAYIQVMLHFHTILMGNMLSTIKPDLGEIKKYMSPVYRLEFNIISRIFSQNPDLYGPILKLNPFTEKIMKSFTNQTEKLINNILDKDLKKFNHDFLKTRKFLGDSCQKAMEESTKVIDYLYSL